MMGKQDSLALHVKRALDSGDLSTTELSELAIHLAHYAGWPTGQMTFDVAVKAMADS